MNPIGELIRRRILAVARHDAAERVAWLLDALVAGGVTAVEFTFTGDDPAPAIECTCLSHPEMIVGAGTIRTIEQIDTAIAAGARFGVSPHLDPELVHAARVRDFAYIPGVLSPSELAQALALGSEAVKLFPVRLGGVGYVSDLLSVFPDAKLLVSGGVSAAEASRYVAAGARIVALGSDLVGSGALKTDRADVTRRARVATQAPPRDGVIGRGGDNA